MSILFQREIGFQAMAHTHMTGKRKYNQSIQIFSLGKMAKGGGGVVRALHIEGFCIV